MVVARATSFRLKAPSLELLQTCSLIFKNETDVGRCWVPLQTKQINGGDGPEDGKLLLCWLCCCWKQGNDDVFGFNLFWIVENTFARAAESPVFRASAKGFEIVR